MNFDRHAVQLYFENKLGCSDVTQWKSYKSGLEAYSFSPGDVTILNTLLLVDSTALYLQGLQSFAQALSGIPRKEFAWPIVKMYYAIFYSMRCELYASSVVAVKCGNIYYSANTDGAVFQHVQEKGSHQTYIKLRKTLPPSVISQDNLLGNEIEAGRDVYSWMCANRERVNYHMKHFTDPEPDDVLEKIYTDYAQPKKLTELFNLYEGDLVYCFDMDHATVAAPYRKLRTCRDLLKGRVQLNPDEQLKQSSVRAQLMALGIAPNVVDRLML